MSGPIKIMLGDQVRMRKRHPCGGEVWEVVRTGMDIRLKCLTCGRRVLLPRAEFERQLKQVVKSQVSLG